MKPSNAWAEYYDLLSAFIVHHLLNNVFDNCDTNSSYQWLRHTGVLIYVSYMKRKKVKKKFFER